MPELILPCGDGDEHVCTAVSVKMYRRYTEIMEHNDSETMEDAIEANAQILSEVFGITKREAERADAEDFLTAAKQVHFMMQEAVTQKFLELSPTRPEPVEQEKSAFDDYDEENGYNDDREEQNFWKACRENVDRVVKLCIRLMKSSYKECMESDIMSLLDYVAFEVRTLKEN